MLDTLMVLLMKGVRAPLLRALMAFLLLCAGIGVLLLLITLSGLKWPGMTATASSVKVNPPGPLSPPPAVPIPHILHNPCAVTPTASVTSHVPRSLNKNQAPTTVQQPGEHFPAIDSPIGIDLTPADPTNGGAVFGQGQSVLRTILNPLLSKLQLKPLSAITPPANCLSNSLAISTPKNVLATVGSFAWLLLSIIGLLMIGGLGLFVTAQRRGRQ